MPPTRPVLAAASLLTLFTACGDAHKNADASADATDTLADAPEATSLDVPDVQVDTLEEAFDAVGPDRETDSDSGDVALPADVLAEQLIGPAGGSIAVGGVELRVPPGALLAATRIRIRGPLPAPDGVMLLSEVLLFEPAGLVFQVPATVTFALPAATSARVFWTSTDAPDEFQALPTRLTGTTASAPIVHFSTVFLADPTTNSAGYFCCSPIDPNMHSDADCISWSAGTGTTCDPSICVAIPGGCPTDPATPGCCSPGPTGDEPTIGCANLLTYGMCALGIGAGLCDWNAGCSTATPNCCSATNPADDNPTAPCAVLGYTDCSAAPKCQYNTSQSCPVPPAPGAPPCASCQDPTWQLDPGFQAAVTAVVQALGGNSCSALAAAPIPPPTTPLGNTAYAGDLGRWCAFEALLGAKACTTSTQAPVCTGLPTSCCTPNAPNAAQPGAACATLTSFDKCEQLNGAGFCAWNPLCGVPVQGCCEPIDPAYDHPGLGCSQMPGFNECVNSLGLGFCQWNPSGQCPAADPCSQCTDPGMLNDADFQLAQQTWLAVNTSPSCTNLAASPTPAPTAPPGTTSWRAELGPWCAYQQALVGLGCSSPSPVCPNLPTDCCFATDPGDDLAQPGGCAALVTQFDCEYQVGLHFCAWNPSCGLATPKQCCVQIDDGLDEPIVGCKNMPDYGECVLSLGFGYCKWDPGAGCPLPAYLSCPNCADPAYTGDPDVQSAYVQSYTAYFQNGCNGVFASPVPAPGGVPQVAANQTLIYETELGRFCGWEAAFSSLGCQPTLAVQPACPPIPKPTTCCSSAVPGIDPAGGTCASLTTYGDCALGAGAGTCVWSPSSSCAVPPNPVCADCVDPVYAADPDVQAAASASTQAYLQLSCGAMLQSPVPPPAGPPSSSSLGATIYETQLGRFCGFETAFLTAQCLPGPTFAPTCPGLPLPGACCSSTSPGVNPPTGPTCAGLSDYPSCIANVGACQWNASPACPSPVPTCTQCADPTHTSNTTFQTYFTISYQAYLSNGCGLMAAAPVPLPSAPIGTNLYELQLGRHCGYQQAVMSGSCGGLVTSSTCPFDLCPTMPSLCPAPLPTCSACTSMTGNPGFLPAFNQQLSSIANGGCLAAQTQGPPAITASIGTPAYAAQAGAWCGHQAAMQQNCNSPGCPAGGCADCLDPQYANLPAFQSALHFGWTRYGAETCGELATIGIPPPNQPSNATGYPAQLGRWCAFQLALEENGCGTSTCPGLSSCSSGQTSCLLPTPTCADCTLLANTSQPAWQAGFAQVSASLGPLSCQQAYTTTPATVWSGPASAPYLNELGKWCAYQDQLEQKCGSLYSQCALP